jgi:methylated-DNA-protein-cysteine methyltransferase-like protein
MNNYYIRVYGLVARIPEGKVATYGQLAAMLGNPLTARQVGYAMNAAPECLQLACHRVVNKKGEMQSGNVFGGAERQRQSLEMEGVIFLENGCVDAKKCMWRPEILNEFNTPVGGK